jgi:hypothetical protein
MEERVALPSAKLRRGMPERVPLLLIGRLAVDQAYQGIGLGTDLLSDALRRCLAASEIAGVRAVVTHAIDDAAVSFYQRHGFVLSPLGERVMLIPMDTTRALFVNPDGQQSLTMLPAQVFRPAPRPRFCHRPDVASLAVLRLSGGFTAWTKTRDSSPPRGVPGRPLASQRVLVGRFVGIWSSSSVAAILKRDRKCPGTNFPNSFHKPRSHGFGPCSDAHQAPDIA